MALEIEDGTGVTGANAYQDVAAAEALLATYGYTSLASIADNEVQESILVRGTLSIDASRHNAATYILKVNRTQGLFYPQYSCVDHITVLGIPSDIILASALRAEHIALTEFVSGPSKTAADIDPMITQIKVAEEVAVSRKAGVSDTVQSRRLDNFVRAVLGRLIRTESEGVAVAAWC